MTKKMMLIIAALSALAALILIIDVVVFRFQNPTLTDTQRLIIQWREIVAMLATIALAGFLFERATE